MLDLIIRLIEIFYPAPELIPEENHNPPADLSEKSLLEAICRGEVD